MKHLRRRWLWMLPILLLLVAISGPRLVWDGLWYDELASVANAGGAPNDPSLGPAGIYARIVTDDPYQALGYPYALALWGNLAGWSEVATRWLSTLLGALALALTFQLGRVVAGGRVGFVAALLLSVSSFFVLYAHEVRAFTLVAALSALFLLSYARLLQQRRSGWAALWFVLSGIGLLYAHYAAAMLLVGVGVYHLLFAPKNRRWLELVGLALLVSISFLPQVPAFLAGYGSYSPAAVSEPPLDTLGVIGTLGHYFSNGALPLLALLLLAGAWTAWRHAGLRMVVGTSLLSAAVLLLANVALEILEPARLRYGIFLWPGLAIWCAAGLVALGDMVTGWLAARTGAVWVRRAAWGVLPVLWLGLSALALAQHDYTDAIDGVTMPRLRAVENTLEVQGASNDLFAYDSGDSQEAWYSRDSLDYITYELPMPFLFTATLYDPARESNRTWAAAQIAGAERVWYGRNRFVTPPADGPDFEADLAEAGFIFCDDYVQQPDASLSLYARSVAWCMDGEALATFGEGATLRGYGLTQNDESLTLELGWALGEAFDEARYSVGAYLMPSGEVNLLAQGDEGFDAPRYDAQQITIGTRELTTGDYDLWLAVYEWESGQRLLTAEGDDLLRLETVSR